jgi:spore cortex biosynthesis protein YabQ
MYAIIGGAIAAFFYDFLRIKRRTIKTNVVILGLEDILYWFAAAIFLFLMVYKSNSGEMRGYIFIGNIIGVLLYESLISNIFIASSVMIINIIKTILLFIFKVLSYPFIIIYKVVKSILKLLYKVIKVIFKPIRTIISTINKKIYSLLDKPVSFISSKLLRAIKMFLDKIKEIISKARVLLKRE